MSSFRPAGSLSVCRALVFAFSSLLVASAVFAGNIVFPTNPPAPEPPVSLSVRNVEITSTGDPTTNYIYTPELSLLAETAESTSATPPIAYEYVWFGGTPVAQVDVATNTTRFTFADHLGTPILQTSASGAVDWRVEYEPYGADYAYRTGALAHQPLRFPGQETTQYAEERDYNIFRWYRAEWGRYTQADPIGLVGGNNLFSYVADNPIGSVDLLGLCCSNREYATELLQAYGIAAAYTQQNIFHQLLSGTLVKNTGRQPSGCGLNADYLVGILNSKLSCWSASRLDRFITLCGAPVFEHSKVKLTPKDKCCNAKDPGSNELDNYYGAPDLRPKH